MVAVFLTVAAYYTQNPPTDQPFGWVMAAFGCVYLLVLIITIVYFLSNQYSRSRRDRRAFFEIVDMLREIRGPLIAKGKLTTLEEAELRIRLSRFAIGPRKSPSNSTGTGEPDTLFHVLRSFIRTAIQVVLPITFSMEGDRDSDRPIVKLSPAEAGEIPASVLDKLVKAGVVEFAGNDVLSKQHQQLEKTVSQSRQPIVEPHCAESDELASEVKLLSADVVKHALEGRKIEAIKLLRKERNLSLSQALKIINEFMAKNECAK
jgi:ribosomal protein L7/L12